MVSEIFFLLRIPRNRSRREEEGEENQQMQSVLLFKQMQKGQLTCPPRLLQMIGLLKLDGAYQWK